MREATDTNELNEHYETSKKIFKKWNYLQSKFHIHQIANKPCTGRRTNPSKGRSFAAPCNIPGCTFIKPGWHFFCVISRAYRQRLYAFECIREITTQVSCIRPREPSHKKGFPFFSPLTRAICNRFERGQIEPAAALGRLLSNRFDTGKLIEGCTKTAVLFHCSTQVPLPEPVVWDRFSFTAPFFPQIYF